MGQLGPILKSVIEEEQANLDPILKDMFTEQDTVAMVTDGLVAAVLDQVSSAITVAKTVSNASNEYLDLSKVQQGRVKIVEGLLLMLEAGPELTEFLTDVRLFEGVEIKDVLREFIAYTQEEPSNEQP